MTPRDDHNAPHWLVVRHLKSRQGPGFLAGWYVVRACPCCWGERVSLPYPNAARAQRVRRVILGEITTCSEPKLQWQREVA